MMCNIVNCPINCEMLPAQPYITHWATNAPWSVRSMQKLAGWILIKFCYFFVTIDLKFTHPVPILRKPKKRPKHQLTIPAILLLLPALLPTTSSSMISLQPVRRRTCACLARNQMDYELSWVPWVPWEKRSGPNCRWNSVIDRNVWTLLPSECRLALETTVEACWRLGFCKFEESCSSDGISEENIQLPLFTVSWINWWPLVPGKAWRHCWRAALS